jgi:amidase
MTTMRASEELADYVAEKSIAQLQADLQSGKVTTRQLALGYLQRILRFDWAGPHLHSVIEINPDALALADALDAERTRQGPRSPLHGIPILLKDNIDTDDRMLTTAGSLALLSSRPTQDATVVRQLRAAGALILGKTNLSEWANFRSNKSISGWSGRGGQTRNAYRPNYTPSGSSSGSGVAAAASLAAATLGTETDGSIVSPSNVNGIVGIKPTLGLTSRAGVAPIAHSQDTVGPMARTVADVAALLGVLTGVDVRDSATVNSAGKFHLDYTQFLDLSGLRGARLGVLRKIATGYDADTDRLFEQALAALHRAGATLVDPADIPTGQAIRESDGEMKVLLYELKYDMAAYLATRAPSLYHPGAPIPRTLADLIAFNQAHAEEELALFGQELFEMAQNLAVSDAQYREILATNQRLAGQEGIDAVLTQHQLDALVAPTGAPAWRIAPKQVDKFLGSCSTPSALAGYPHLTVPMGFIDGLPAGLSFLGRAWSEPTLIKLAYAYEQATQMRRPPVYP